MKRIFITLALVSIALVGFSQNNLINLTGGYSWMNVDDSDLVDEDPNIKATGWRITGTYDYNPNDGKIAYGFSIGYISVNGTYNGTVDTNNYQLNSIPFYFAPKYLFGNERIKGFIKLAIGGQSATMKRTGTSTDLTGSDFGFYGGAGGGLMVFVHENVFLNFEYEIAYVTNNYYRNGLLQSASGGIGVKF